MFQQIIVITIIVSMIWYTVFYILSVRPAQLEKKIGESSYKRCAILRKISFIGIGLCMISEVLYFFFPLEMGFKLRIIDSLAGWIICISIGIILGVLATLIIKEVSKVALDSFVPKKENEMFRGIYERIRHPQAIADVIYWFTFAFVFNSSFLLIIAIIWIPLNYLIVLFEEQDLKVRYGLSYLDYMKRTGRFIPKQGKKKMN